MDEDLEYEKAFMAVLSFMRTSFYYLCPNKTPEEEHVAWSVVENMFPANRRYLYDIIRDYWAICCETGLPSPLPAKGITFNTVPELDGRVLNYLMDSRYRLMKALPVAELRPFQYAFFMIDVFIDRYQKLCFDRCFG